MPTIKSDPTRERTESITFIEKAILLSMFPPNSSFLLLVAGDQKESSR